MFDKEAPEGYNVGWNVGKRALWPELDRTDCEEIALTHEINAMMCTDVLCSFQGMQVVVTLGRRTASMQSAGRSRSVEGLEDFAAYGAPEADYAKMLGPMR